MEQTSLDKVIEATNRYNEDLKKYIAGKLNRLAVFDLGNTFGELSNHLSKANLYMRQGIITKAIKHGVDIKDLQDLPLKLYRAEHIFKSKKENNVVPLVDIKDKEGQSVVIPIDTQSQGFEGMTANGINEITSIYGKKENVLEFWKKEGMELYDKNHARRPSPILGVSVNENNDTKVNKNFETTKSFAEKMADLTKKNTDKFRKPMNNNNLDRGKSL